MVEHGLKGVHIQYFFPVIGKGILKFCKCKRSLGTYLEARHYEDLLSGALFLRTFGDN